MPNHQSAEKQARKSLKARDLNRTIRSEIRSSLKKLRATTVKAEAAKQLPNLFSILDKAARRNQGGISKNTASNYKRKAQLTVQALTK